VILTFDYHIMKGYTKAYEVVFSTDQQKLVEE